MAAAIAGDRLVTLVGPGGLGKTRLVTEMIGQHSAAADFPAGGAFVDLVPVSGDYIVHAVAAALGVVERAQEPLESIVHQRLQQGRCLLVLDNCEHLLGAAAAFTEAALAACPSLVVLATSRERLGVPGERVINLDPLPPRAAGRLFEDRAGADDRDCERDRAAIAEICRRLDGMPLAIELAAARSGSLGVDGVIAGLDDHLRLLSRASGTADRHHSLRRVLEWSHELLDDEERELFRRLGVFAGSFDLAAASAVAAGGNVATASDGLGRLADKSLLARVRDRGPTGSRWRMLETVQAFAREQLDEHGERAAFARRHLEWAAVTAREIEVALEADDPSWEARFDAVADDCRAALAAAPVGTGDEVDFQLAMALGHLAYAHRFLVEGREHLDTAVRRAPYEADAVRALRLAADAALAELRGESAFALLMDAHTRAMGCGDLRSAALALGEAISIAARSPATFADELSHEELLALLDDLRAIAPEGDLEVAAQVALAETWTGRPEPSEPDPAIAQRALALARELDDPVRISNALDAVAAAAANEGRMKDGARVTVERLALLSRLPRHLPRAGGEMADIFFMGSEGAMAAGEFDDALEAAAIARDDVFGQGLAHFAASHFVMPLVMQGRFDDALAHAAVMYDGWERSGRPAAGWMAPSFFATAMVHGVRGDDAAYAEWWRRARAIAARTRINGFSLYVAPRVALHRGHLDVAVATSASHRQPVVGRYRAYTRAVNVEIAVVTGAPDALQQLAEARPLAAENEFVNAMLTRAAAQLHDDDAQKEAELERSVAMWEAVGARFERACTLMLLPDRADEGDRELTALGCFIPAHLRRT